MYFSFRKIRGVAWERAKPLECVRVGSSANSGCSMEFNP